MPDPVLNAFHILILIHLILLRTLRGGHHNLHFKDEETEALRG